MVAGSETDETRATGGTARATTTYQAEQIPDDLGGALAEIKRESRGLIEALEKAAAAEIAAVLAAARQGGRKLDLPALLAILRRAKQSVMSSARQRASDEAGSRRSALLRDRRRGPRP